MLRLDPDLIEVIVRLGLACSNPYVNLRQLLFDNRMVGKSGYVVVEKVLWRMDEGWRDDFTEDREILMGVVAGNIKTCLDPADLPE
ncbi:hypothetical protein [Arthrobacter silvisoli]|uniref:hypothetical protein n=1 Tax=Arthrobacter silvisoli TaxID=2291022 RepID=UPI00109BC456|nr:hypothetical protein [Arthrobacter silvisoli]